MADFWSCTACLTFPSLIRRALRGLRSQTGVCTMQCLPSATWKIPVRNQDGYLASSPTENAKNLKGQLLIVQGMLDE